MSDFIKRIAEAICVEECGGDFLLHLQDAIKAKPEVISGGVAALAFAAALSAEKALNRYAKLARAAIASMHDAPKSALWAGALYAKTDRDLEIWNAMIAELLRE